MKWFFDLGNRYAERSNWVDFALTKFCLFSMGIIVGLFIPHEYRGTVVTVAAVVFVITYVPLMIKMYKVAKEK